MHRHRAPGAATRTPNGVCGRARWSSRIGDQDRGADRAAPLVGPGGRIVYVTCSVLPQENGAQVRDFLARHPGFQQVAPADVLAVLGD